MQTPILLTNAFNSGDPTQLARSGRELQQNPDTGWPHIVGSTPKLK